jgi:hypothetical protein
MMEALLASCGHESLDVALMFFGGLVRLRAIAGTVHSNRSRQRESLARLESRLEQLSLLLSHLARWAFVPRHDGEIVYVELVDFDAEGRR